MVHLSMCELRILEEMFLYFTSTTITVQVNIQKFRWPIQIVTINFVNKNKTLFCLRRVKISLPFLNNQIRRLQR